MDTQGISTKCMEKWIKPKELKNLCKSLAVLSWICGDSTRYKYNQVKSEFSFENGQGDSANIVFKDNDVLFLAFAHEAIFAYWDGANHIFPDQNGNFLPRTFKDYYEEYLDEERISILAWFLIKDKKWTNFPLIDEERVEDAKGEDDPDGSELIWDYLPLNPELYCLWEGEYFDLEIDLSIVEKIYAHKKLNYEDVFKVNPNTLMCRKEFEDMLVSIGYHES